jgi:hypothetical protein
LIFSFFNSNSNLNFGAGSYRWVPLLSRAVTNGKKTLHGIRGRFVLVRHIFGV